jgi:cytochrome c553
MKKLLLTIALFSLTVTSQAQDIAAGKNKYVTCSACHGAQAQGGMGAKLQGQKPEVIVQKLTAYKNKEQRGPQSALMWAQASQLSSADMANIAAYIATIK